MIRNKVVGDEHYSFNQFTVQNISHYLQSIFPSYASLIQQQDR